VIKQQEKNAEETVLLINQRLSSGKKQDLGYLDDIGMNALEKGMIIKVFDNDGKTIWDATIHNNGLCEQMLTSMQSNMQNYYSKEEGGYVEKIYILEGDSQPVGNVIVGYYGPYFYTDSDLYFINTINTLLIWAGIASIILALILGIIISNQLTRPILRVIQRAKLIAQGQFEKMISEKSNTKEIVLLSETIHNLSETLKKQQEFSRQTSLDIAHELRTPLTTIQGNLEAVIDGVMKPDKHRIELLHEEVLRINRLVDDLGELAHFESESFVLNKSKFDLTRLIEKTVKTLENYLHNEGRKIIFNGQRAEILADRDKIKQVVINLLSNALKYTKPGGKVEIDVKKHHDHIILTVSDDGIGISKEELPNVFDRFYRVDKSRNRMTGGSGIGLTIVKSIVDAHGGEIKVNSKKDFGTKFIVKIPSK
jgi:two-component system, OmpR family, sensor histidine kinase BaeS